MKYQYGIFAGSKWWRCLNKARAIAYAKQINGEVRAMGYDRESWDAPTFYALSDRIADFRVAAPSSL